MVSSEANGGRAERAGGTRVADYLRKSGLPIEVRVLATESTRTSKDAAFNLGCTISEIAKTVAFTDSEIGTRSYLVVLSGDKRVNVMALEKHFGVGKLRKMNAEEVREKTGYPIGGVPPFPHNSGLVIVADESLFRFQSVWAAAGTPSSVMKISPDVLRNEMGYSLVRVSE